MYNNEIETLSLDKLRNLQNRRLIDLVNRVYTNVPFYKKKFDNAGIICSDIKRVEDLHKIPFTKKSDLRDYYPFGLFAVPEEEVIRVHASSGSTGKPTVVGYNRYDLDLFDEVMARSLVAGGAKSGMKIHNACGYGLFTGGLGVHGGATKLGMMVIPVSAGMTDRQILILQDFKPEMIVGTPSYIHTLGEEIKNRGISKKDINLKYAIMGAEPWTETILTEVEKLLHVNATNLYGLSEIIGPGVSQEDYEEKGFGSYIWEDHFYPEIVDRDTGEPLPYGEEGVLILTTLTKQALPLLRYWTNDICSIYYDKSGKRTHIKMSFIKGRTDDMLIIRGVNLFPTQVELILGSFTQLTPNFQLIATREGTLDELKLIVEVNEDLSSRFNDNGFLSSEKIVALKNDLSNKVKQNIGLNMQVELKEVGQMPRSAGGKLNRIKDLRKLS